jgi:hypothetical protein
VRKPQSGRIEVPKIPACSLGNASKTGGSFGSVTGAPAQPFRLRRKGFAPTQPPIGSALSPTNPRLTEQENGICHRGIRPEKTRPCHPIDTQSPPKPIPMNVKRLLKIALTQDQTFSK